MGGLDMRSTETLLQGGKSGPAVVPGEAPRSLLYQAASHAGALKMPPGAGPLPAADLSILRDWINQEESWRPHPDEPVFTDAQKSFWSFQPIRDPKPPKIENDEWANSDLDRFILAKLNEQGLSPVPQADRLTLIRRLTYDLTGLPPTPEEIQTFLAESSEKSEDGNDAYSSSPWAKLMDRLLESPHYGERWGRRWLDVVRYADTGGSEGNYVMPYAYRYRDYVVHAFNQDKPYNDFIIEQLAGDLLPATKDLDLGLQRMIATGFLMLGPKGTSEADKEQLRLDIADEQIEVTSKAFLGLTVSCARCHDHKFDPIPTRDYYSLAGIFMSTETLSDREMFSMWWQYPVLEIPGGEKVTVMAPKEGQPTDLRVHIRGNHNHLGKEAPRGFLRIIAGNQPSRIGNQESGRLQLARWIADPENPLTARVMVNRIWQGHFGVGLVATSNNFGATGESPSHPELLDWLASRFIENKWSIKAIHHLILLSNTYQMRSLPDEQGLRVDPANRLLSRIPRRRLDAEELRDSILSINGRLDRTVGGDIFDWQKNNETVDEERGLFSASIGGQGFKAYQSRRRSIYLPVVRNILPDVFQLFDFPDASSVAGKRDETTVPLQALFLMNSPFVREQSLHFAKQLLEGISRDPLFETLYQLGLAREKDEDRLRLAHLKVLGRAPTEEELEQAVSFLNEYVEQIKSGGESAEQARLAAWKSYCQSLVCLNEFLYLD